MLSRRSFLKNASILAIVQLISGCSQDKDALKVLLLQGSIPPQLLGAFKKQVVESKNLIFKPELQLKDLFDLLQNWQKPSQDRDNYWNWLPLIDRRTPKVANLVTLGDYYLKDAIQKQLIKPLTIEQIPNWKQVPLRWQNLVRRNNNGAIDNRGSIWGAPYRWGTTAIAYRKDKFADLGWTPKDWDDLWRKELRGNISLLDSSREIIGLTLKKMGYSYNTENLSSIDNLKAELLALHQQVKFYADDRYLQPLILGDTWLAVGWSADILSLVSRYPEIEVAIPRSGTSLWTDLWVMPKQNAADSNNQSIDLSIIDRWIDFCWQPQSASQISLFTDAASPVVLSLKPQDLPTDLQKNSLLTPDKETIDHSEFLYPLSTETTKQYQQLWREIRL